MDFHDRRFLQNFAMFIAFLVLLAVGFLFLAGQLASRSGDENFKTSRVAEARADARLKPVGVVRLAGARSTVSQATPAPTGGAAAAVFNTPQAVHHLMAGQGCFACHAIHSKLVGPAYAWVAYRYRSDVGVAVVKLAHKIISGGAGYWNPWTGGLAMPAHPTLTLAEAEAMAHWVLARHPLAPPKP